MTITLAAVYAPIGFVSGLTGALFREFAFTLAGAVIVSGLIALTLSPMMCSKLLRRNTGETRLTHTLDKAFEWLSNRYQGLLRASLRAPWVAVVLCVAIGFGAYLLIQMIPREYAPQEDRGQFNASLQAPEGTTYARLMESAQKVEAYL